MSTSLSIASVKFSLEYLNTSDVSSHLEYLWLDYIKDQFHRTSEIELKCSKLLIDCLRDSINSLLSERSGQHLTHNDFFDLLSRSNGSIWRDVFITIKATNLSSNVTMKLCISLREVTLKLLSDAGLLRFNELQIFMLFFDWVLQEFFSVWGSENKLDNGPVLDIKNIRTIAESVRSPVDLNPVLQSIVDRVRGSGLWQMCAIGIIDPDDQEIRVPAHSGFSENYPANIKFPADGSATLAAIHQKQAIAINDVYANQEFPVLHEAASAAGYNSILLIPIFIAEMRAVMAFCTAEAHKYHEEEITLANAIAQQVMIAIENAHQRHREKQRGDELESLNQLIAEQNRLLQDAVDIHTTLTQLVLNGAGLDLILEEVRELLGNPVAIEDMHFNLLAFSQDWDYFDQHRRESISSGGTVQSLFDNLKMASTFEDLHNQRRALLMPILPEVGIEKRRIVAPIIAGAEILGYVWVMEALRTFDELHDRITTEQAALIFALEMMKQRAAYETELRLKADFLSDIVSNVSIKESDLRQRASFLGFNFNKPSLLMVVDIERRLWEGFDALKIQEHYRQIILRIQTAVTHIAGDSLVANQSGRIVVIISLVNKSRQQKIVAELDSLIRKEINRMYGDVSVMIAIGDVFEGVTDVRASFHQAIRTLDAAKRLGRENETLKLSDLGIYGILFRDGESDELIEFARNSLSSLIEYDKQNGTELLQTLDTFLNHQTKFAETARALNIHVNTLRQRIERIELTLNINLRDSFAVLNLHLALRVHELLPGRHRLE